MAVMPVRRLLLNMAWPMMLSMLIQALYNLVDSMFVAQLSSDGFVALALVYPIQTLMIAVCVGTGVGFNALLARRLGEGRPDEANRVVANGYFVYLVCWVVFLVLGVGLAPVFMGLFAPGQPQVIDYGIQYLSIVTGASVGICMQFAGERTLQATGNTVGPMVIQGIGAVINLILDPLLIFGIGPFPRMEVAGAALATVIGQICGALLALMFNLRKNTDVHFQLKNLRPSAPIIGGIYSVGVPSIAMQSIGSVMVFGMNQILIAFTATATAVFGVYFKLQSFIFMPVFGLNNGMVPIIAYNYGARKPERIVKTIKLSVMYAVGIMLLGLLAFQLIPDVFLKMFMAEDSGSDMLTIGVPALRIISISFLLAGFSVVCSSVFQALGHGVLSLAVSVIRQLVVLLPAAWLLARTGSVNNVWWAFLIAEVVSLLLSLAFFARINKTVIAPLYGPEEP